MLHVQQPPSGCARLGNLLKKAREIRGLSQTRLAEIANGHHANPTIVRARVAQWEGGHRRIGAADLAVLELALNVKLGGVDRGDASAHHGSGWCWLSPASPGSIACRTTGMELL